MTEPLTADELAEARSMARMLRNFAGAMPPVRYEEAADMLDNLQAEVERLREQVAAGDRLQNALSAVPRRSTRQRDTEMGNVGPSEAD